jgi:D-galactarolactone isomerase
MPVDSQTRPKLKAPPGTCDTHIHIYDNRFPRAATAKILAPDALVPAYKKMAARLGIERTVVVQPSAYGTDNRCTLEAVAALGPNARAVVTVDQTATDAELVRLTKLGARGLRFFMLAGAPLPLEILETMAARVAAFGWHIVFQIDGRDYADYEPLLKRISAPVIIDHVGKFLEPVPLDHAGVRAVLRLLDSGRFYIKLAAPYETSKVGPPNYDDVGRLAKAFAKAAPERTLWASNWPHPSGGAQTPDDAWMLDMLLDWIPDETSRRQALVDNPARLYGF